jgi:hypothetical protein
MARYWLALLDDVLTWLNPILGCVAAMLLVLVIQAVDERLSGNRISLAIEVNRPVKTVSAIECPAATLPREWRELRLYD